MTEQCRRLSDTYNNDTPSMLQDNDTDSMSNNKVDDYRLSALQSGNCTTMLKLTHWANLYKSIVNLSYDMVHIQEIKLI